MITSVPLTYDFYLDQLIMYFPNGTGHIPFSIPVSAGGE